MDTSFDYVFDKQFDDINLNNELKTFYDFINNDELNELFEEEKKLTDIRNQNYKRYSDINLLQIENLSEDLNNIVNEIKKLYSFIISKNLLEETKEEAEETKKILDLIDSHLNKLTDILEKKLKILEKENNERQEKIKSINSSDYDKKVLEVVLNKYNEIVLYNSVIENNVFDNYKIQLRRSNDINELYNILNIKLEQSNKSIDEISDLNSKINNEIMNIKDKFMYLEDLMMEKSKYEGELLVFKTYFNSLIAYDDSDYTDVIRVYSALCDNLKIKSLIEYFEESFIKEREQSKKEEEFVYEKYGDKNIKTSLDYITANYMDNITEEEKQLVNDLYEKINGESYNIEEIYNRFSVFTNNIWKRTITDIYSYKQNEDFYFICTNNEFIDEKHESILITKKMLERVTDYSEYQIGFICNFNNNIMYITENDDITTIDYEDMSNLKTPKQLEQEFVNFRVCNRIALNGYLTNISAVYFIDDGDFIKYKKSIELANQHNLPLIILKKDKN